MHRLFVYGTLKPGEPNAHELDGLKGDWRTAHVRGRLYPSGWGAAMGYPGVILDEDGDRVAGMLFTSADLPEHWGRLDAFEGEGYERVMTRVTLEDGEGTDAYIYALADKTPPVP